MIEIPSKYQLNIKNSFIESPNNIVINAVAGSGKTSTILWLLSFVKKRNESLMCAFNKTIANELSDRCIGMGRVKISTIHSLGLKILFQNGYKAEINEKKYRQIIKSLSDTWSKKKKYDSDFENYIFGLVNLLRNNNICDDVLAKEFILNSENTLEYEYDLGLDFILNCCTDAIELGIKDKKSIDFIDMIFIPLFFKFKPTNTYDNIFVDEIQDLNACQKEIVLSYANKKSKIVWIGDKKQAIYLFAGSDAKSFEKITQLPNTIELPLSVNYRCPKKIIRYAQEIVPNIEACDNAIEGELDMFGKIEEIKSGDMVLCRMNMPLVKLCIEFITKGIKCFIKGNDIGASLITIIKKTKTSTVTELNNKLEEQNNKIIKRLEEKYKLTTEEAKKEKEYILFQDKIEAITALSKEFTLTSDIIKRIENIFKEKGEGIVLSTIHKAKGLETDNIFIICDWLTPAFFAKTKEQKEQESNLNYVARTRARKKLSIIRDFNPYQKSREQLILFFIFNEQKDKILLKNGDYLPMYKKTKFDDETRYEKKLGFPEGTFKKIELDKNNNAQLTLQENFSVPGYSFIKIEEIKNFKIKDKIKTFPNQN